MILFDIETSAHLAQQLLFNIVSNFVPTVKYCLCEILRYKNWFGANTLGNHCVGLDEY